MTDIKTGKHRVKASSWFWNRTASGNMELNILFPLPGSATESGEATEITARLYFTEKTQKRTAESLRALGFVGNDIMTITDEGGGGIGSNTVEIVIGHEAYEGVTRARVEWINSLQRAGAAPRDAPSTAEKARFADDMKGVFALFDAKKPAGSAGSAGSGGASSGHDQTKPAAPQVPAVVTKIVAGVRDISTAAGAWLDNKGKLEDPVKKILWPSLIKASGVTPDVLKAAIAVEEQRRTDADASSNADDDIPF